METGREAATEIGLSHTSLPLEIWSTFIFPQLPTLQDRLNCAHTCQTWRPWVLLSVESLSLPNIDKKVKRKIPEELINLLGASWYDEADRAGCAGSSGMACLTPGCMWSSSERQFGFCSQCLREAQAAKVDLKR